MVKLSIKQIFQTCYNSLTNRLQTIIVIGVASSRRSKLNSTQIVNNVYDSTTQKIRLIKV